MNGTNGNGADHGPDIEWPEDVDFWAGCKLTTTLTDPPRHELSLPSGQILRLKTGDFFDVRRFTMVFIDCVGSFPPLPEKKPGVFLRDAFKAWLASRAVVVFAEEEASDRGALVGDIRRAIATCPETEDPRDLDRGALYRRADGDVWVNARILLERVRRACPVKFPPADFYVALASLGAKNLEVQRDQGWRGRAWLVPHKLLPEPELLPEKAAPSSTIVTEPEPVTDQGAFDGLIDP
jgi:hypothetical protein